MAQKMHPFSKLVAGVSTAAIAVACWQAWQDYQQDIMPDHAPDSITAEPPSEPDYTQEQYNNFHFDDRGYERGSAAFIFNLACQNADDKYQKYCNAALDVQDSMGIDASVLMGALAMETGFRDYASSDSEAQGDLQIQPQFLITEIFNHGQDLPYYNNLEENDPRRLAIDNVRNNTLVFNDEGEEVGNGKADRADRIQAQYKAHYNNGTPFENEHDRVLHELRYDLDFAMQLSAAAMLREFPEAHISSFGGSWNEDFDKRRDVAARAYSSHNMGPTGASYQLALAEHYPDLRLNDDEGMNAALETLQQQNGWRNFELETARVNASWNPRVFNEGKDGIDTCYGDVLANLREQMDASLETFRGGLATAAAVSRQSFDDYLQTNVDITQTYHNDDPTVEVSMRPTARPHDLDTSSYTSFMSANATSETAVAFNTSACEPLNSTAPQVSLRPVKRPKTNPYQIVTN